MLIDPHHTQQIRVGSIAAYELARGLEARRVRSAEFATTGSNSGGRDALGQVGRRSARRVGGHGMGRAGDHYVASLITACGADVDNPVGGGNHVHIVFDHDHGIAGIDEPVELGEQQ
jgi:hypothetical protein